MKQLSLVWHIHQPLFIPDHEVLRQVKESYLNIIETHQSLNLPVTINVTGVLLERLEKIYPKMIDELVKLSRSGLVELVGSGYYHPMLPILKPEYASEQIKRDLEIKRRLFGKKITGFWPTDLGWAPWMTTMLKFHGLDWVIIDAPSLTLANSLPQWEEKFQGAHKVLSPKIESITLNNELHQLYQSTQNQQTIKVLIRDRFKSIRLTDFETGVIYNQDQISQYLESVETDVGDNNLVVIAEDGERINAQTFRNYKLVVEKFSKSKSLQAVRVSDGVKSFSKAIERYFPASTFEFDLEPWQSSMDDVSYTNYLNQIIEKIERLELKNYQVKNQVVDSLIAQAKDLLLKAQDSGCVFWKFHDRTRKMGWDWILSAEAMINNAAGLI